MSSITSSYGVPGSANSQLVDERDSRLRTVIKNDMPDHSGAETTWPLAVRRPSTIARYVKTDRRLLHTVISRFQTIQ